jgi:xylan 1,4-beta-xylosidase
MSTLHLHANLTTVIATPLPHVWSACVGAGRANEGLRADWQEQLAIAQRECGFRSIRFHGIFHDDMFVLRRRDGQDRYLWHYVDALYDRLLALGVKPFVELAFMPRDLARQTGTVFWWKANGSPPTDLGRWRDLISAFTRHLVDRYGLEEVRTWPFEVWNEPNLGAFFAGTYSEYLDLYAATVTAVKAVDAAIQVGGPSTSNFVPDARFDGETWDTSFLTPTDVPDETLPWRPVWIERFLRDCAARNLPVDFISTHPYPTEGALDQDGKSIQFTRHRDATLHDLTQLRKLIRSSPYPHARIHCTEWSTSPSPRDHGHDELPAACWLLRANLQAVGLVDSLSYWVFTDIFEEGGAGEATFHGGFGLMNVHGLPKPAYHAYRFLHGLGHERLAGEDGWLLSHHSDGRLAAVIWNYADGFSKTPNIAYTRDRAQADAEVGTTATLDIELHGVTPGATFVLDICDAQHGHALRAWERMGAPEPPTREQTAQLMTAARGLQQIKLQADAAGKLRHRMTLAPWAIASLRQR